MPSKYQVIAESERAQPSGWRERGTHKEGFGRSCRSFTSKIHTRAPDFKLTGSDVSDYQAVADLMGVSVGKPRMPLAAATLWLPPCLYIFPVLHGR